MKAVKRIYVEVEPFVHGVLGTFCRSETRPVCLAGDRSDHSNPASIIIVTCITFLATHTSDPPPPPAFVASYLAFPYVPLTGLSTA